MTIARVGLERGAAVRAVARGAREPGAALGAELGIGLGPGTVGWTCGTRDGGRGTSDHRGKTRPPSLVPRPRLRAECRQGFRGVFVLQRLVVRVREFSRRAVEFDLLERTQGDGLGREVVVGVLPLSLLPPSPLPPPPSPPPWGGDSLREPEESRRRGEGPGRGVG